MSAPSPGSPTAFRLARIAALVLGSLVFLHACERSESAVLSDVWGEVVVAAVFVAAALVAAWFEIELRAQERDDDVARPGPASRWVDDAEQAEAPIRGNFSRRGRRFADEEYPEDEPGERVGRAARSMPRADDHSEPDEYSARPDLVAGIARTLRIGRPDAEDERPLLSTWNAVTKWARRGEPDEDDEIDDLDDEIEQITRTETGELVVESGTRTIRVKIGRSGDLVVHGRVTGGPHPRSEWRWTFPPDTFHDIRAALGDRSGDLLDLLEETIPWLDAGARHDPGAWLRAHDIPATYREKGVSASQVTRELPVIRPGLPPQPPRPGKPHRLSEDAPPTRHPRTGSAEPADVRDARFPARRERHPVPARAAEPLPSPRESRSPRKNAADPRSSSRRADADRPSRGGASRSTQQRSGNDRQSRSARRHRDNPDPARPSGPFPATAAEDPGLSLRPTPGRPDLPRRRRQEPSGEPADQRYAGRHTPQPSLDPRSDYEADAHPSHREPRRQRNPYAATDFDSRPGRRAQPELQRRDRFAPGDQAAEPHRDQPPPRRRNGDQRSRRDQPTPSHESTSRRRW
ncbi:hypothetical protein [Nocardia pneumoniae]|uniref:hypothetical protein n=1 Tax=Nocardia pneumoniae TaxID=228601 RepID=UPI0012F6EBEC|nr:hypothetical protein [Nocardia pneumoniae]